MTDSPSTPQHRHHMFKLLSVCILLAACAIVISIACWRVGWPAWQRYAATREIVRARKVADVDGFEKAVRKVNDRFGVDSTIWPLIDALADENESIRRRAASFLGEAGPDARHAVPSLVERLCEVREHGRDEFVDGLQELGEIALPGLIAGLESKDDRIRKWSAELLGRTRSNAASAAIPKLVTLLQSDSSISVRAVAARSLGCLDRNGQSIPALIDATRDDNYGVQMQSETALGAMGPLAREAIPALTELLDKHHDTFRINVAHSLARIHGFHECPTEEVIEALNHEDTVVRLAAIRGMCWHSEAAAMAIPQLVDALSHPNRNVRMTAAYVLADLGKVAEDAVQELTKALDDPDEDVRVWASRAIKEIRPADHEAQ